jgi:hypothetical protein
MKNKNTTKGALKRRYIDQRKEAYQEYKQKNGSGKGWRSSPEIKRIKRNEKRAITRIESKRIAKRSGSANLIFASDDAFFLQTLSETDEGAALQAFREMEIAGEKPTAVVIFFTNEKRVKKSEVGYMMDVAELFRQASKIQNWYLVNKKKAVYPMVEVRAGMYRGKYFVVTEGKSPKVRIQGNKITEIIKESPSMIQKDKKTKK